MLGLRQMPMGGAMRESFCVDVGDADELGGWRSGSGAPVLTLHGGPGLSFSYLDAMIDDIGSGYDVATYQQRGLPPSTPRCPLDIAEAVDDAVRVLDHLGWDKAWVVGHSWGGHLLLHLAAARPDRLLGGLAVDPLGGVGDGGLAAFEAAMTDRATDEVRARLEEMDRTTEKDRPGDDAMREQLSLMWPGYFADPSTAPPMPEIGVSAVAYSTLMEAALEHLPFLEGALPTLETPIGFLAGSMSPLPVDISTRMTAERIPQSWVEVADGAGHFPWYERPGSVRRALDRLTRR